MTTLREMRLATGRSQRAFAALVGMPIETYRPFDSGRRAAGTALLDRAEQLVNQHRRDSDLFTLDSLVGEFDIHPRTLRAAARDGRLQVHLSTKSVFGRPLRLATRSAMDAFVRVHYRQRYSRFAPAGVSATEGHDPVELCFTPHWSSTQAATDPEGACVADRRR